MYDSSLDIKLSNQGLEDFCECIGELMTHHILIINDALHHAFSKIETLIEEQYHHMDGYQLGQYYYYDQIQDYVVRLKLQYEVLTPSQIRIHAIKTRWFPGEPPPTIGLSNVYVLRDELLAEEEQIDFYLFYRWLRKKRTPNHTEIETWDMCIDTEYPRANVEQICFDVNGDVVAPAGFRFWLKPDRTRGLQTSTQEYCHTKKLEHYRLKAGFAHELFVLLAGITYRDVLILDILKQFLELEIVEQPLFFHQINGVIRKKAYTDDLTVCVYVNDEPANTSEKFAKTFRDFPGLQDQRPEKGQMVISIAGQRRGFPGTLKEGTALLGDLRLPNHRIESCGRVTTWLGHHEDEKGSGTNEPAYTSEKFAKTFRDFPGLQNQRPEKGQMVISIAGQWQGFPGTLKEGTALLSDPRLPNHRIEPCGRVTTWLGREDGKGAGAFGEAGLSQPRLCYGKSKGMFGSDRVVAHKPFLYGSNRSDLQLTLN